MLSEHPRLGHDTEFRPRAATHAAISTRSASVPAPPTYPTLLATDELLAPATNPPPRIYALDKDRKAMGASTSPTAPFVDRQ